METRLVILRILAIFPLLKPPLAHFPLPLPPPYAQTIPVNVLRTHMLRLPMLPEKNVKFSIKGAFISEEP